MARVMVVDDDPEVRCLLRTMLAGTGHQVVGQAGNGEDAIAQALVCQPDAILMDVRMPLMDGIKATGVLRAKYAYHGRIVLYSGFSLPQVEAHAYRAGADAFLAKPLSQAQLVTALVGRQAAAAG